MWDGNKIIIEDLCGIKSTTEIPEIFSQVEMLTF
jgi:hypothetical protein